MTLGDLRKSLTRFPSDLDDSEIVFIYQDSTGKIDYDLLTFVGYADLDKDKNPVLVMGSMRAALKKMKDGTLSYPDGSKPTDTSFDLNG